MQKIYMGSNTKPDTVRVAYYKPASGALLEFSERGGRDIKSEMAAASLTIVLMQNRQKNEEANASSASMLVTPQRLI